MGENGEFQDRAAELSSQDAQLSSSTDQIAREYDDLLTSIRHSFETKMGSEPSPAFKMDAENYLHCQVTSYDCITMLQWYDVQNPALKDLIKLYGTHEDQLKLQQFEQHRDEYFFDENRQRMVPESNELYKQLNLIPGAILFLFLVDPKWDSICSNKWLNGIHDYIKRRNQRDNSSCFVYFCTLRKVSSIMSL